MSDTSLVFNLVARDNTEQGLSSARERFDQTATGIGAGVAAALGVSLAQEIDTQAANAKLAAQLSLGPQEAADVAKVSASVYKDAWGDSTETVNLAIKGVYQNIGDTSAAEGGLEGVTSKVVALAETFDQDLTMATAAAGQMVRTGLADNVDEALDILAVGLGTSADKAGDLLETFNEYSTQFRRLGIDGQTATGLIAQGLQNGAKDGDQVADALGQFGEIALAGGTSVDAAFKSIGLNADTMADKIGKGGVTSQEALQMTLDALRGTTDQTVRLNAAGALFGDPGKIMGDALYALDPAGAAAAAGMGEAEGAMDQLMATMGDSASKDLERFKRQALGKLGEVTGGFISFATDNKAVFEPLAYTLAGLAATVLVVKAAMITYSAVSSVVAAANAVISFSGWGVAATWIRMNAIGLAAYARIAIGAVASAATTAAAWTGSALVSIGTWILSVIRAGAVAAFQFAVMAVKAVAWAAVMAAQWLIAMGPIGWVIAAIVGLTALVIANWDTVRQWTGVVWGWVSTAVKAAVGATVGWVMGLARIPGMVAGYFGRMKDAAVAKSMSLVNWVRGLPGRVVSMLGNIGSLLWNAGSSLISGFINGIKAKLGAVKDAASSIVSAARDFFPFSPAREGPFSGTGYTSYSGAALVAGFEDGITSRIPSLRSVLDGLPGIAPQSVQTPLTAGMAPVLGASAGGGVQRLIVDVRGADEDLKRLFRKMVRLDGGGSTGNAFDRRR
ncbi:phage tail tape measure protein [Streptomyces sp. NPDC020951]|uniref:phage tail tape measure protein n=1 Tax=Streptomyces sp. NPDC020951 TaxID=3365104 RepID=UPI0037AF736E